MEKLCVLITSSSSFLVRHSQEYILRDAVVDTIGILAKVEHQSSGAAATNGLVLRLSGLLADKEALCHSDTDVAISSNIVLVLGKIVSRVNDLAVCPQRLRYCAACPICSMTDMPAHALPVMACCAAPTGSSGLGCGGANSP